MWGPSAGQTHKSFRRADGSPGRLLGAMLAKVVTGPFGDKKHKSFRRARCAGSRREFRHKFLGELEPCASGTEDSLNGMLGTISQRADSHPNGGVYMVIKQTAHLSPACEKTADGDSSPSDSWAYKSGWCSMKVLTGSEDLLGDSYPSI